MTELEGVVENLLFASEDSGYSVVKLRSGGQLVTVVGNLSTPVPGERLHLKGRWTDHPASGGRAPSTSTTPTLRLRARGSSAT